MALATERAQPVVGIALKVTSTVVFTLMATLVKLASADYPIGEIVFFRSFFALIPVLVWVVARGHFPEALYTSRLHRHFFRSVAGAGGMFTGFTALALLPIADATAIGYAAPLMTVVLAVIFLGEKVRIYRWSAVAVGFDRRAGHPVRLCRPGSFGGEAGQRDRRGHRGGGAFLGAIATTQVRAMVRHRGAVDHRHLFLAVLRRWPAWSASRSRRGRCRGRSMRPCWSAPASAAASAR